MHSDVEPEPESTRVLKRFRGGPGPRPTTQSLFSSLLAKKKTQQLERTCSGNGDDDIEEFSSPEDLIFRDEHHQHSIILWVAVRKFHCRVMQFLPLNHQAS
ncbi:hypothetical protein Dsin_023049 [Dipteronia sinensis]|uniref:Uncharacterized protein n=1 Tax=Dipteronia sinensis TaxID=43782 RepID=A0AAE0A3N0_9ROSI|nr:hypothetical protein Dsin_023049 [Dipteronia sinensis]